MSRRKKFQRMWERADLALVPTLAGWNRKVSEMEQHRAGFGEINEGGSFMVQSGSKGGSQVDAAVDFFAPLGTLSTEGAAIVLACYLPPNMMHDQPRIVAYLKTLGIRPQDNGWTWPSYRARAAGSYCRAFWKRVREQ